MSKHTIRHSPTHHQPTHQITRITAAEPVMESEWAKSDLNYPHHGNQTHYPAACGWVGVKARPAEHHMDTSGRNVGRIKYAYPSHMASVARCMLVLRCYSWQGNAADMVMMVWRRESSAACVMRLILSPNRIAHWRIVIIPSMTIIPSYSLPGNLTPKPDTTTTTAAACSFYACSSCCCCCCVPCVGWLVCRIHRDDWMVG